MSKLARLALGAALAVTAGPAVSAAAETPEDTLVQAWQIDDMITLDPAEVFEFTAAEYAAQVYDRLISYPADDVENLQGHIAETLGDRGRRQDLHVQDPRRHHLPLGQPAER